MRFDLPAVDILGTSELGAVMPVLGLDGRPVSNAKGAPVTLTLRGHDSQAYAEAVQAQAQAATTRAQSHKGPAPAIDFELARQERIQLLVACTVGWSGFIDENHGDVEFSALRAAMLYQQFPVIRDQAERFVHDRTNFLPPSSNS